MNESAENVVYVCGVVGWGMSTKLLPIHATGQRNGKDGIVDGLHNKVMSQKTNSITFDFQYWRKVFEKGNS